MKVCTECLLRMLKGTVTTALENVKQDISGWMAHNMNSMKLVILLHPLCWSIHTKDESKRGTAFAFIFGVNWLWRCGVTASFGVFHEIRCNGMTSFMEFMIYTFFFVLNSMNQTMQRWHKLNKSRYHCYYIGCSWKHLNLRVILCKTCVLFSPSKLCVKIFCFKQQWLKQCQDEVSYNENSFWLDWMLLVWGILTCGDPLQNVYTFFT